MRLRPNDSTMRRRNNESVINAKMMAVFVTLKIIRIVPMILESVDDVRKLMSPKPTVVISVTTKYHASIHDSCSA